MKVPISKRLLACAGMIHPGDRVADVGTDHGYLAIHLLREGLAGYVYCSDIGEQPLQKARDNARRFGVRQGISFHLCDGVRGLPRQFDVLVMAGMGAETMVRILQGGQWLKSGDYRLVLQCQSSQNELRQYLSENGWNISREEPVRDGKFIYTVLEAIPAPEKLSPGQHFVSPALRRCDSPLVGEYISFCRQVCRKVVLGLRDYPGPKLDYYKTALRELTELEAAVVTSAAGQAPDSAAKPRKQETQP